jgi:hypothetical protein
MTKQKETSEEEVRYEGSVVFQPISGLVRHLIDEIFRHHTVLCVLVELSQEEILRG